MFSEFSGEIVSTSTNKRDKWRGNTVKEIKVRWFLSKSEMSNYNEKTWKGML